MVQPVAPSQIQVAAASEITGVLFDFAGTLLVPRPADELLAAGAASIGLRLPAPELSRLAAAYLEAGIPGAPYPSSVPEELGALYSRRDLSGELHRRAYVGLMETVEVAPAGVHGLPQAVYEQILTPDGWVPYADARAVVGELVERGIRVGLVSNVGFDIRPILRHHGFAELAARCTLSVDVGVTKPDPQIFQTALRALGGEPGSTLMVGDHESADGGAAAVGMRTLILPLTAPGTVHGLARVLELVGDEGAAGDSR